LGPGLTFRVPYLDWGINSKVGTRRIFTRKGLGNWTEGIIRKGRLIGGRKLLGKERENRGKIFWSPNFLDLELSFKPREALDLVSSPFQGKVSQILTF